MKKIYEILNKKEKKEEEINWDKTELLDHAGEWVSGFYKGTEPFIELCGSKENKYSSQYKIFFSLDTGICKIYREKKQ